MMMSIQPAKNDRKKERIAGIKNIPQYLDNPTYTACPSFLPSMYAMINLPAVMLAFSLRLIIAGGADASAPPAFLFLAPCLH